jgi:hypothetical protein
MCDHLDDGEPEPGSGFTLAVATAEALEGMLEELRREAGAFVGDVELEGAVRSRNGESNLAVAVAECILDEVGESLLEAETIAVQRLAGLDPTRDRSSRCLGSPLEASRHRGEQVSGIERLEAKRQPPPLEARDQEEVFGELRQPIDILSRRANRPAELLGRVAVSECEIQLRA